MTPHLPSRRRASDLCAAEDGIARWFCALPRATPPAVDVSQAAPPRAPGRSSPGFGWRSLAAAAALLAVFVAPGQAPAAGPPGGTPRLSAASSFTVVDDPSVPALHALDTFEQLAWLRR